MAEESIIYKQVLDAQKPQRTSRDKPPARGRGKVTVTAKQAKELKDGMAALMQLGSLGAGLLWPRAWTLDDQLTQEECEAESEAIYRVLETSNPQLIIWLLQADKWAPYVMLGLTTVSIAAPRLTRRKILPEGAAAGLGSLSSLAAMMNMAQAAAESVSEPPPATENNGASVHETEPAPRDNVAAAVPPAPAPRTVVSGRAPEPDRPDKERKVNTRNGAAPVSGVADRVPQQDGPGETANPLPGASGDPDVGPVNLAEILSIRVEAEV